MNQPPAAQQPAAPQPPAQRTPTPAPGTGWASPASPSPYAPPAQHTPAHPYPPPQQYAPQPGPAGYGPYPAGHHLAAGRPAGLRPAAVTAIAVACGLVGVLLGVTGTLAATSGDRADGASVAPEGLAQDVLPQRLPELVAFVEEETGLLFGSRPEVELLDDGPFVAALLAPSEYGPAEPDVADFDRTSLALGLVDDLDTTAMDAQVSQTDGVAGFYDPPTDRLVVRGVQWSPAVEVTVVHELVHALQDQHVDLDAAAARTRTDDESYLASTAVVEGHATVVEEAWLAAQGSTYEEEYWAEVYDASPEAASEPLVDALTMLPYDLGWQAVSATVTEQGPDAAWALLREPPTTLEQVWDLTGRTDHDADSAPWSPPAVAVAEPQAAADGQVVDRGSLGAHLLTLLVTPDRDDWFDLDGLLAGWAGDRYVTWTTPADEVCTRVDVAVDTDAVVAMRDELASWDESGGTLTDGPGGTLRLERCSAQ